MRNSVAAKDIPWAAWRLARKAIFESLRVLPIRTHVEIARLRGRIYAAVRGVPPHVRENIEATLGDGLTSSDVDQIALGHFQYTKRAYLAKFLPLLRDFDNPRQWQIQGLEHLDEALARNRGAILTTAHLGYPRLIAPVLRTYGYEVAQVVDGGTGRSVQKPKQAFEELLANASNFRRRIYERTRVVVYRKDSRDIAATLDVRPIFDALSRNQVVMIVGDGMRAVEFARLSLLGRDYPFPTGFMKIAMLTEAPLLPVFIVDGDRQNRLRLEIHPPLPIDPRGDVGTNLQLFADVLDNQIQRTPHLWNRWKTKNVFDKVLAWSESQIQLRYETRWNNPSSKRTAGDHENSTRKNYPTKSVERI